ncbi:MAG: hypothetical protein ACTHKB_07105, partial [Burkholderiaceae bacterium]
MAARLARCFVKCLLLAALLPAVAPQAAPPRFAEVTPLPYGTALAFPRDFGAHPSYRTEWWYATGWLTLPDGKPL